MDSRKCTTAKLKRLCKRLGSKNAAGKVSLKEIEEVIAETREKNAAISMLCDAIRRAN